MGGNIADGDFDGGVGEGVRRRLIEEEGIAPRDPGFLLLPRPEFFCLLNIRKSEWDIWKYCHFQRRVKS